MYSTERFEHHHAMPVDLAGLSRRAESRNAIVYRANLLPIVPLGAMRLTAVSKKSVSGFVDGAIHPLQRVVFDFGCFGSRVVSVASCDGNHLFGRFEEPWLTLPPVLRALARAGVRRWQWRVRPEPDVVVPVALAGNASVVIVRNMCKSGAMIETNAPLIAGQSVIFYLSHGQPLSARVRWTSDGLAGLRFGTPGDDEGAGVVAAQPSGATPLPPLARLDDVQESPDSALLALEVMAMTAAQCCNAATAFLGLTPFVLSRIGGERHPSPHIRRFNGSLMAQTMQQRDLLVIPDLLAHGVHDDLAALPCVRNARFWAAAPLRTGHGLPLGALCIADPMPRSQGLDPAQSTHVRALAQQISNQLESWL